MKNAHQSKLESILSTHTGIFLGVDNTQFLILKDKHQWFIKQFSLLCSGGGWGAQQTAYLDLTLVKIFAAMMVLMVYRVSDADNAWGLLEILP